jgi:hypothetical protein
MKYYLLYSLVLLCCLGTIAQNKDTTKKTDIKFTILEAGIYLAVPRNESFVSASDYSLGFELNSYFTIADRYQIGLGYNQFKLDNHDFKRTGYIGETTNTAFYVMLGYQYRFNEKMTTSLNYSIGTATYKHDLIDSPEDFEDGAFYNNISIKFNYALNEQLSLHLHASYRMDFLDVDVPAEIESFYDTATYFNTGLSLSYTHHFKSKK